MTGGLVLFAVRAHVAAVQSALAVGGGADRAFDAIYAGVIRGAARVTRVVLPGSLSFYLSMVLIAFAAVPALAMSGAWDLPDDVVIAESPLQALLGVAVVVGAIGTALTRRRFAAVLTLGTVGYGVAMLFVVQGAPDLALTQFLIETVSLVLFPLVLRRLPEEFARRRSRSLRFGHAAISVAVGIAVFGLAVSSLAARTAPPIGREMSEIAYPEGGGANAVNVILADIRAFDTLGEIVVVTVAAFGTAALVRAGRPRRGRTADDVRAGRQLEEPDRETA